MSSTCTGGLYVEATLESGRNNETRSPTGGFPVLASSRKFVWRFRPGMRRFLFEANTTMNLFGGRFVEGKSHWLLLSASFQPLRFTVFVPAL